MRRTKNFTRRQTEKSLLSQLFIPSINLGGNYRNRGTVHEATNMKVNVDGGSIDLPDWACELIDIGEKSWSKGQNGHQTVIALSLPSIGHAAALVSFGAVRAAIKSGFGQTGEGLSFDALKKMVGASVEFKDVRLGKTKKIVSRKGLISGVDEWNGEERLMVKYKQTSDKLYEKAFYLGDVHALTLLNEPVTDIDLQGRGMVLGGTANIHFVSSFLTPLELNQLYAPSRPRIRVVDNKTRFQGEIEAMDYGSGGGIGCLGEMIRPDFMAKYANSAKTDFQSSMNRSVISEKDNVLVLAGAKSVIRNIRNQSARCVVALLDRTDSDNGVAEAELNSEFADRDESLAVAESLQDGNIRVMAFTRSL